MRVPQIDTDHVNFGEKFTEEDAEQLITELMIAHQGAFTFTFVDGGKDKGKIRIEGGL